MADIKKLAEEIVALTLLEAQELKTLLKDEYGIELLLAELLLWLQLEMMLLLAKKKMNLT